MTEWLQITNRRPERDENLRYCEGCSNWRRIDDYRFIDGVCFECALGNVEGVRRRREKITRNHIFGRQSAIRSISDRVWNSGDIHIEADPEDHGVGRTQVESWLQSLRGDEQ